MAAVGGRAKKVVVYLDGRPALSLEPEVAAAANLKVKSDLNDAQLGELGRRNEFRRALTASERLLSFRPRSESELRQKLMRKGFDAEAIASAMVHLKGRGLVEDTSFARYWAENRAAFSPRSRRMVMLELRQKGVSAADAAEGSGEFDDETAAYEAGAKKASRLTGVDYEEFRRRTGEFLKRRGFSYDTIDRSLRRLWEEQVNKE